MSKIEEEFPGLEEVAWFNGRVESAFKYKCPTTTYSMLLSVFDCIESRKNKIVPSLFGVIGDSDQLLKASQELRVVERLQQKFYMWVLTKLALDKNPKVQKCLLSNQKLHMKSQLRENALVLYFDKEYAGLSIIIVAND